MRQQDKVIVWPAYFDSTKTRKQGRRVPKNLAVAAPRISEIKESADKLGLLNELVPDVGYPKNPWLKNGMLLVKKEGSKNETLTAIAKQLLKARSSSLPPLRK